MKKFYLGMDIGTNSVGMACTDENYRLLRAKGKDCWTVRLFSEGLTAEGRRFFKTARGTTALFMQRIKRNCSAAIKTVCLPTERIPIKNIMPNILRFIICAAICRGSPYAI